MAMKPCRPVDGDLNKVKFPCYMQPKIDGVRAINLQGITTARSLKRFPNKYFNAVFNRSSFLGLDGEMCAVAADETDIEKALCASDLCRRTTSAISSIEGEQRYLWVLFDYLMGDAISLRYQERLNRLRAWIDQYYSSGLYNQFQAEVIMIPTYYVTSAEQFLQLDSEFVDKGYEGSIIRNIDGYHKNGAATQKGMEVWRFKHFIDEEAEVLDIIEGQENQNEAQTNELGNTFRSTHKDNMVPNGMVGALLCRRLATGEKIKVAAGKMSVEDRIYYFQNPHLIVGEIIVYRSFPRGVKDKPRFATYQTIRAKVDYLPPEK